MLKNPRYLYKENINSFLNTKRTEIFGMLCEGYHGNTLTTTREAWSNEIKILQNQLSTWKDSNGQIIFEYDIPRLGKRIDVVLLLKGIIFCLEFKVGESKIIENDIDQVLDYALDLRNFHKFSESKVIVPILIATKYQKYSSNIQKSVYNDNVLNPLVTGEGGIQELINKVLNLYPNEEDIDTNWSISPYAPTPTIIEPARTLYESHSVEDITRHEADKVTTDTTIAYILDVIKHSKENREKSICFVTGVPGAGKTLVGLEVAV